MKNINAFDEDLERSYGVNKLVLNRIATYIFCEACCNSQSGNYHINIEDVEETFNVKIDKDTYMNICELLFDNFSLQILDLNENDDEYYFENEKEFNITIGGYYTIYGDTDYED